MMTTGRYPGLQAGSIRPRESIAFPHRSILVQWPPIQRIGLTYPDLLTVAGAAQAFGRNKAAHLFPV